MAPMRNFLVPHSVQMDRVAGRPFLMDGLDVAGRGLGLALDAVNFDGFRRRRHG